jgi:deazaflavin-dependent oxidoreductase (nitroreductase family)
MNQQVVREFRAKNGRIGGQPSGAAMLLLTTVGARSGREHTVPLRYVRDGDRLLVVASGDGSARQPAWYHNLLAHPMVQVETGTETYGAVAVPAEGKDRHRLFGRIAREAPAYTDQERRALRPFPVVVLERSYPLAGLDTVTTLADGLVTIHNWLRALLRQVRAESDAHFVAQAAHHRPAGSTTTSLTLQLRQYCLAFCGALHGHHTDEDARILPDVERRHPQLRGALERLRDEHETVARIQGELAELLADIGTADPNVFRAALARMCTELEAHLEYEEEALIPVLAGVPLPSSRRNDGLPGQVAPDRTGETRS